MIRLYLRTVGLRGLLYATGNMITKSTGFFTLKRKDCAYPFRLRIPSSDVRAYKQVFIKKGYDFSVSTQPETIVDAGANIGLVSIFFANKYPGAKIIAIEPEQSNYNLLKDNTAPYPNIIPIQAALWNTNEVINIIDPGLGKWGFMTEGANSLGSLRGETCHTVKAVTLDTIIEDCKLVKIDILKIDIEGAEREVFSDTSSWIEKVDSIIIELHEHMKAGCNRSFYCGSNGFDDEWRQGESVYLSRRNFIRRHST